MQANSTVDNAVHALTREERDNHPGRGGGIPSAKDMHAAMVALRQGRITPDEFRAIMRASRSTDPDGHDSRTFAATVAFNR